MGQIRKICIVTEAWNQINGVTTTLEKTKENLEQLGYEVRIVHPGLFCNFEFPLYRDINIVYRPNQVYRELRSINPDAYHVATEGPLGLMAIRWLKGRKIPFTTSFHTRWPEFLSDKFRIPKKLTSLYLKWFHGHSYKILTTTEEMKTPLCKMGFNPNSLVVWSRGVDTNLFSPQKRNNPQDTLVYVGRVSQEKNLDAFLGLDRPEKKIVVGDGPYLSTLRTKYPDVEFRGAKRGEELAKEYANASAMVFPSLNDTFGLVMLESMSTGTPVAAFPVTGPRNLIKSKMNGFMSCDLNHAINEAKKVNRQTTRNFAKQYSWQDCTKTFLNNLKPIRR